MSQDSIDLNKNNTQSNLDSKKDNEHQIKITVENNKDNLSPEVLRIIKLVRESDNEMIEKSDEEILVLLKMMYGCSAWETN